MAGEQWSSDTFLSRCTNCLHRKQTSSWKPGVYTLILITLVLLIGQSQGHNTKEVQSSDINSLLANLHTSSHGNSVAKQPLTLKLPDSTAMVGKIFRYNLRDYTSGDGAVLYKINEVGKPNLPSWLTYDKDIFTLSGVASENDTGPLFLEVTATSKANTNNKDVFTVHVVHEPAHGSSRIPLTSSNSIQESTRPIRCQKKQAVTMVTIVIDTDFNTLVPQRRVSLLNDMMKHLQLGPDILQLVPSNNKPLSDASAIVAGPGNVKDVKHGGVFMKWRVGCGNVDASYMPILQKLEATSQNGRMASDIGHPVVGWHVTSNHVVHRRIRRQAQYTATAVITQTPPTKVRGKTTVVEETTATSIESVSDMTRTVPTMASPVVTKPHRTKTTGRHLHTKTMAVTSSTVVVKPSAVHSSSSVLPVVPSKVKASTVAVTPSVVVTQPGTVAQTATTTASTTPQMVVSTTLEPSAKPDVVTPGITTPLDTVTPSLHIVSPEPSKPTKTTAMPTKITKPTKKPRVTKKPVPVKTTTMKPIKTTGTKQPITAEVTTKPVVIEITTPVVVSTTLMNEQPKIKNSIKPIKLHLGDILNMTIPRDTFVDFEDGDTRHLKLIFMDKEGKGVTMDSWIKFDQKSQTLYGLPTQPSHVGLHQFTMAAVDSQSKVARDVFYVEVVDDESALPLSHELSATLGLNYDEFIINVNMQMEVANNLAKYFGDSDSSNMKITRLKKGSVIYAWTNTSLPSEPCPIHAIKQLLKYLISENRTINPQFIEAMKPIAILSIAADPKGSCDRDPNFQPIVISSKPMKDKNRETSDDNLVKIIVIPVVAIVALILLAGIIACCLYRRHRKGKLSDEDHHTFINKGIPVIFADELDEKLDPPTKPLIMEDEKPPQSPPDYKGSRSGSSGSSTPPSDHKPLDSTLDDDFDQDLSTAPLYQPPPPVYPSKHDNGLPVRSTDKGNYRAVPTYVPP